MGWGVGVCPFLLPWEPSVELPFASVIQGKLQLPFASVKASVLLPFASVMQAKLKGPKKLEFTNERNHVYPNLNSLHGFFSHRSYIYRDIWRGIKGYMGI